jgi:rSAM/selenodomain-associated transferase 2
MAACAVRGQVTIVSVIMPALNEAESIHQAISAARRGYAPDEVEIIVVDGGSIDGTPERLSPSVTLLRMGRGRGAQMNRGASASHGEILLFCHADSQLPAGWREAVIEALSEPGVSGGTFQTLILPARGILMHIRNRMRFPATWWRMYGDQVQFMRRDTFACVGGFPKIPLMEDVEMMRALRREGRLVKLPLRVATSSRRFLERGFLRQALMNLWSMFRYLNLKTTPDDIARVYRSRREEVL